MTLPTISVIGVKKKPARRKSAAAPIRTAARPPEVPAPATPQPDGSGAPNAGQGPVAPPSMASQMTVNGTTLNARPFTRPGELLEATPGLIVTQHSGEGKANQYSCAATTSTTAPISRSASTTCRSTCALTPTARVTPT